MAGAHSNINKVSDPTRDDEFYKDGILCGRQRGEATAVNQMAASRGMGLIRDPGDEIKEGSGNRLNCICYNC